MPLVTSGNEKRPFFATTFMGSFNDQPGAWHNGTSFGFNDLEALMNVVFEAGVDHAQRLKRAPLKTI
jgi:hypothetical protein